MAAPVISVVTTATAVTVAITGTVGVTYTARLSTPEGAEEDEASRAGSGSVTLTPASAGRKLVLAWPSDGDEPSVVEEITVPEEDDETEVAYYRVVRLDRVPGAPFKVAFVERIEKPTEPR